jgi:ankyrin repeat protein
LFVTFKRAFIAISLLAISAPAGAQFSDSYNFLKAVRERNGSKAIELLNKGGPTLVDTPDGTTGERGIHIAVKDRDLSWIGFLMQKGARVDLKDRDGNTPLMVAARISFLDAARLLIAKGAQVNTANSLGETPLIMAAQKRDLAMVRLLLTQGADPAKRDIASGMSARDYALRDGRSEMIVRLIDETKPIAKKDISGPK